MRLISAFLLAFTVVARLSVADEPNAAQAYLLKYRFKPGQFVHFEVESSTSMTIAAKEFKQTTTETRQSKKHFRVVSVASDGSAVLEPMIDQVSITIQNDDDKPITFDSTSEEVPSKVFKPVKESIGKAMVRLRYKATGAAIDVLPVSGNDHKISTDPAQHAFLTVLPEKPVAIGESWNDDFIVPVTVRLTENRTGKRDVAIRRRYTLKDVKDNIATIEFRIYPLDVIREPDLQAQLIQRSLSGEVQFNIQQGMQVELTSSGSGQVTGAIGPGSTLATTARNHEKLAQPDHANEKPAAGPALPPVAVSAFKP